MPTRTGNLAICALALATLAGGCEFYQTRQARDACTEAYQDATPPWSTIRAADRCVTLLYPRPASAEVTERPEALHDHRLLLSAWLDDHQAALGDAEGMVTARFALDAEGAVRDPRVLLGSGVDALDAAVLALSADFAFARDPEEADGELTMEYVVGFRGGDGPSATPGPEAQDAENRDAPESARPQPSVARVTVYELEDSSEDEPKWRIDVVGPLRGYSGVYELTWRHADDEPARQMTIPATAVVPDSAAALERRIAARFGDDFPAAGTVRSLLRSHDPENQPEQESDAVTPSPA